MKIFFLISIILFNLIAECNAALLQSNTNPEPIDSAVRNYYQHVYNAENFLMKGQNDSAFARYILAEKYNDRFNIDKGNDNKCFFSTENEDLKVEWLTRGYKFSSDSASPDEFIERVSCYLSEQGIKKIKESLKDVKRIHTDDISKYKKISEIFEPLFDKDQLYRIPGAFEKYNNTLKLMKKADRENFRTVMKCYSLYGSISTVRLSSDAYEAIRVILLHNLFDKKKYKKYNRLVNIEL